MSDAQDLTVSELREILRSKALLMSGNKAELILRIEEANPDGSWVREYYEENNPFVREARQEAQRLTDERNAMAQRIADLQRQLEVLAAERISLRSTNDEDGAVGGAPLGVLNAASNGDVDDAADGANNFDLRRNNTGDNSQRLQEEARRQLNQHGDALRIPGLINSERQRLLTTRARGAFETDNNGSGGQFRLDADLRLGGYRATTTPTEAVTTGASSRRDDLKLVKTVGDLLSNFSGSSDNFECWERQVKLLIRMYDLSENATRILIGTKLKGKAESWFHSKPEHLELTSENLLIGLRKMFFRRINKVNLRKEFENRIWKNDEKFSEYVHDKIILANKVPIDDSELIDYLIDGIPNENLRDQARMQQFDSEEALLNAFDKIMLRNDNDAKVNKNVEQKSENSNERSDTKAGKSDVKKRCYNCGDSTHLSYDCTKEKREKGSCYKCSSLDHLFKDCPLNKN